MTADPSVGFRSGTLGGFALRARKRPHLELTNMRVAELLVERDSLEVLDDDLEPYPLDAACVGLFVNLAHQQSADAGRCSLGTTPRPPIQASAASHAEVHEPDTRVVSNGDDRCGAVEVVRRRHEPQRIGGHGDRHQIVGVRRGEELRELVLGQGRRRSELRLSIAPRLVALVLLDRERSPLTRT